MRGAGQPNQLLGRPAAPGPPAYAQHTVLFPGQFRGFPGAVDADNRGSMRLLKTFPADQIHAYRRAVRRWPGGDLFVVSDPDPQRDIGRGKGSLHYRGGETDLSAFWQHVESNLEELRRLRSAGATEPMLRHWSGN